MTIVDKVSKLLLTANKEMSLKDIYANLPEHTPASIRGNINRAIINDSTDIIRTGKGMYSIIEIIKVEKAETGCKINYSVTSFSEGNIIASFHKEFEAKDTGIKAGIYKRSKEYDLSGKMLSDFNSLVGVLTNDNAVDVMKELKSESFDLLVTDPPYKTISGGKGGKNAPRGMLSKNDGKIFDFNNIKHEEWIPETYRLLKPGAQAYIFTNLINLKTIWNCAEKSGFKIHNILIWEKNNATPNRWYMKNCEYVLYLYKPSKGQPVRINDCGSKTVHQFDNIIGSKAHETEKPVDLLEMYIKNSSKKGDWVLDPFAGSNSTMAAAVKNDRKCFSCEIDKKYIFNGINRIKTVLS